MTDFNDEFVQELDYDPNEDAKALGELDEIEYEQAMIDYENWLDEVAEWKGLAGFGYKIG
jgi:hypothetical protein